MEYLKDIGAVLGILLLTFVIIPWGFMCLMSLIKSIFKAFWNENNRFD